MTHVLLKCKKLNPFARELHLECEKKVVPHLQQNFPHVACLPRGMKHWAGGASWPLSCGGKEHRFSSPSGKEGGETVGPEIQASSFQFKIPSIVPLFPNKQCL